MIDGHPFPAIPLPYELNQTAFRPGFCLGTDEFNTPEELVERIEKEIQICCYSNARDQPFSATIVQMENYRKDKTVHSLMIETSR